MDRREFLEQVAAWSAGACLATPVFNVPSILAAEGKAKGTFAAGRRQGQGLCGPGRAGDEAAGRHRRLRQQGRPRGREAEHRLGPHARASAPTPIPTWSRPSCSSASTPGAKQVLVFDRTVNDARRCYAKSGIQAAVESIGDSRAQCVFQDENKFVPVQIEKAKSIKEFHFYKDALATRVRLLHQCAHRQAPLPVEAHLG